MRYLKIYFNVNNNGFRLFYEEDKFINIEGFAINFSFSYYFNRANYYKTGLLEKIKEELESRNIEWMKIEGNKALIKLPELKKNVKELKEIDWLQGNIWLEPEIEKDIEKKKTKVSFMATKEEIEANYPKKIFLSHKGIDKPIVRKFKETLEQLKFDPWLDEDAMPAGTALERGILKGFKDSCGAVFFITPSFKDEKYLKTEIDYAIAEKRKKIDLQSLLLYLKKTEKKLKFQNF